MPIINQPFQGKLGDILIDELQKEYTSLTIFSAFAKNSGVLRMKSALEKFRKNGGKIRLFVGVDLDGTSYEALLNLFALCDELYVIHSENVATTYHSKIYLLKSDSNAWCAVGSNNLTGGGLWTNFESSSIESYELPKDIDKLSNIDAIVDKYMDSNYVCSSKITSIDDIDQLLASNYISKEVTQRVETAKKISTRKQQQKKNPLFGTEKVSIPRLVIERISPPPASPGQSAKPQTVDYTVWGKQGVSNPAFTNEQFWFEMRESTGGSRNILDLSKLGRIEAGSVKGTPYEYVDPNKMYGGIKFFDIDPEDTDVEKDITINYLGKDYYPSTIKFAPNNGSWRIQLKGSPNDDSIELSKYGNRGDFVHKILVFEKISTDYYVLSLLDEEDLDNIKKVSQVWARNGSSANSKAYGML